MTPQTTSKGKLSKTRRGFIFLLAGLLIFYHIKIVYGLYLGGASGVHDTMTNVQSFIRIAVALSLTIVIFGMRFALWGMWSASPRWLRPSIWFTTAPSHQRSSFPGQASLT